LFLQAEFEAVQVLDLALVIADVLRHALFLSFDHLKLHGDLVLDFVFPVAHHFLIFEYSLPHRVSCLLNLVLLPTDPIHSIFLARLQLLNFLQMHRLHLLPKRFHLVSIPRRLLHPDPRHFKLLQAAHFVRQVGLIAQFALLLVLHHTLLHGFEWSGPLYVDLVNKGVINARQLLLQRHHGVATHVLRLRVGCLLVRGKAALSFDAVDEVEEQRGGVAFGFDVVVSLQMQDFDELAFDEHFLGDARFGEED
jgi:hypothetical protein